MTNSKAATHIFYRVDQAVSDELLERGRPLSKERILANEKAAILCYDGMNLTFGNKMAEDALLDLQDSDGFRKTERFDLASADRAGDKNSRRIKSDFPAAHSSDLHFPGAFHRISASNELSSVIIHR